MAETTPKSAQLYVGPAGWSYPDWDGIVYPAQRPRGFRPLVFLARYFNLVEINSTFYRIPSPQQCEKWIEAIEPFEEFLFTVKLWQEFTHVRERLDTQALNQWHAALNPLRRADRLGAVLVQFPWSFRCTRENARYIEELAMALAPDPLAIEVRHDSWDCEEFVGWLRENGHAFCNIDQPLLERCLPPTGHVTAPFAYVRLHGRNRENWFRENADVGERYKYLYSRQELEEWAERLKRLIEKAEKVFVITNNHTEGRAAANALQIKSMVLNEKVACPATLIRRYPDLADYVTSPPKEQSGGPIEGEQLSFF